jgi:ribonuclease BN (tRNA processing enzyme)
MLIDCGSDARLSLYELGLNYDDIDDIYVSHLHADHVGGLEWMGFCRKYYSDREKPRLHISRSMVNNLWRNVLSGGMKSSSFAEKTNSLNSFFEVDAVGKKGSFEWRKIQFKLVKTVHIHEGKKAKPSYGLFFTVNRHSIFITTDTKFCPGIFMDYYQKADLIFHDCEIASIKSGVHAHYDELINLDKSIKAKIWLYHYNPDPLPNAKKEGFRGFVKKGQVFDLTNENTFK